MLSPGHGGKVIHELLPSPSSSRPEPRPDHLEPGGHALEVVGRPEHEVLGGCDGGEVIDVGTIAQKEDGAGVAAPQHEGG